jgi:hypothetical protein
MTIDDVAEADIQFVLDHVKRNPAIWFDAPTLLRDLRRADQHFTMRRLHLAVRALADTECVIERETMGQPEWRVFTPAPSKRALASIEPLMKGHSVARNGSSATHVSREEIDVAVKTSALRGMSADLYRHLLSRPDGDETDAIAKALKKGTAPVSASLGSLTKRGFLTRERMGGFPRRYRYRALWKREESVTKRRKSDSGSYGGKKPAQAHGRDGVGPPSTPSAPRRALGAGLDAEVELIASVTRALECAQSAGVSPERIREAVDYAVKRITQ